VIFYRQSDIPEIPELCWLLTCVTGKGLLNRANAYTAAMDKNAASGTEPDDGVTAGLFMYPVLMAADILMFQAHQVPVGRDQVQHLEMARDIAASFNHLYGAHLVLPEADVDENVALLPGLDGRKMSKSYDNTIALFAPRTVMHKQIMGIVTDSKGPGEPKDTESSALYAIYRAFADDDESARFAQAFARGIGWADAKQQLFERIEQELEPMRTRYEHFMQHPEEVEAILRAGAGKARAIATPFLDALRHAVGLRRLTERTSAAKGAAHRSKADLPAFKQYREQDGLFYFKLVAPDGTVLLQSTGFAAPRDAGQAIAQLRAGGANALAHLATVLQHPADAAARAALESLRAESEASPTAQ
jgi:tryptophanyl-tRNA synthetase